MKTAPVIVTKLTQTPKGYWTARVSRNGSTVDVDNRYGSWNAVVRVAPRVREFERRDVLPDVAAELQDRLRKAGGKVAKR